MMQEAIFQPTARMSQQHQSLAVQVANFSFSAMIGVSLLMLVALSVSEEVIVMKDGLPQFAELSVPGYILGVLALLSTASRGYLFSAGAIREHWVQNQIQFLISAVIGVYFLADLLLF